MNRIIGLLNVERNRKSKLFKEFGFRELFFDILCGTRDKEMHLIVSDTPCQYIYIHSILHTVIYLTKGISIATSYIIVF